MKLDVRFCREGVGGIFLSDGILNYVGGNGTFGTPCGQYGLIRSETLENASQSVFDCGGFETRVDYIAGETLEMRVVFKNKGQKRLFKKGELGVRACFNDSYDKAEICLAGRCHAHVWVAEDVAYIVGRRMDGADGGVAMLLIEGRLGGYAVERKENSNDRGDFFLLAPDTELDAGEELSIGFSIFAVKDTEDFFAKAARYPSFCRVGAERFTINGEEKARLFIECAQKPQVVSGVEGVEACGDGKFRAEIALPSGESKVFIRYGQRETFAEFNRVDFEKTVDGRLEFIVDRQQCFSKFNKFYGAYFLYDNETDRTFVENKPINDRNIARERSGMICALMTRLLKGNLKPELKNKYLYSVKTGLKFIDKNIVKDNGQVCEAPIYRRNPFTDRLYNYSMYMLVYALAYELLGDDKYIKKAAAVAEKYYSKGGERFYAINLPFCGICEGMTAAGFEDGAKRLKSLFLAHGDRVVETGVNFPPHEVKYEQSIVAPSVDILLECFKLSGDKKYLAEAERQLPLLEAFCGFQPSCHTDGIAIRHWDGFWFGKRKLYGDTFPHYWSCINAAVYYKYAEITGKSEYFSKADKILENNLCLFDGEGRGYCAYLYPDFVNKKEGKFYDPWANDQDWALYYYNRYHGCK